MMPSDPDPASIAQQVLTARDGLGWSREKLAAEAGVSFPSIYRLERGRMPSVETLSRVADALGTSVDFLLGRANELDPAHS